MKRLLTLALASVLAVGCMASCKKKNNSSFTPTWDGERVYTYNTYTTVSPSNWNELTYLDNNDTQIMQYLAGSFFEFDFKYDSNGNIIDGEFDVEYDFATDLQDVTATYAEEYGLDKTKTGYVWEITIREDGKWDDGTAIKAEDFVYSMKEQLNPDFKNFRADSYYNGSVNLVNAWEYVFQDTTDWYASTTPYKEYSDSLDSELYFYLGQKVIGEGSDAKKVDTYFRTSMQLPASYDAAKTAAYLKANYVPTLDTDVVATMEGKTFAEIKADTAMKAEWDKIIKWWQTEPNEELHFFVSEYTLPELSFDKVGIKADGDYKIIVALTSPIEFKDAEGNLTYHCPYEFASLPLVHKAKYEANKVAPTTEGALWTSTYNSSVESTASWGPYKLTKFQAGKHYQLEKNQNWYGWNMEKNEGLYQTDVISCETIEKYETAFLNFRQGGIDSIGMDVSISADYKNSKQAYFTPEDYVGSIQLQSSKEALKKRETSGVNKTILTYSDFRRGLSLGLDRADFVNKCTTSSLAGFGLYNSMHYIDIANGITYRSTDAAKKALCDVYGVDVTKYATLDDAVDSITGYDLKQAREAITSAYNAAKAAGDIKDGDKVVLVYGSSTDNESVRRNYDYLNDTWKNLMVGTPLEGKFELTFNASYGSDWADKFRAGEYDICQAGWNGAAWNPGYFIMAYLSPAYMYSTGWDTSSHNITITVHGVNENGVVTNDANDVYTSERAIYGESGNSWYELLNGAYGQGYLNDEFRCEILAQMEEEVLKQYYTIPYSNYFSASLHSYKIEYVTYTYNTFCGYGGIKYMKYNYCDGEWKQFVQFYNGEINYK